MALAKNTEVKEPETIDMFAEDIDGLVDDDPETIAKLDDAPEELQGEIVSANVKAPSTAVAPSNPGGVSSTTTGAILNSLAEDGFEGVDLTGFGAFPIIALNDGQFVATEGWELGESFEGVMVGSRNKFIFKNGTKDVDDEEFFYSYDGVLDTQGGEVVERLNAWKALGYTPVRKPYVDISVILTGEDHAGEFCLLSVPKTSISRWSGYLVKLGLQHKGKKPQEVVTRFGKAKKVGSGTRSFTPISFEYVRDNDVA